MNTFPTRAKYLREIARATSAHQVNDFMNHPSGRVRRAVTRRIAHLERAAAKPFLPVAFHRDGSTSPLERFVHDNSKPVDLEFQKLVARFTAEGKPNPEKSARASLARKAQLNKKIEPAFDGGF